MPLPRQRTASDDNVVRISGIGRLDLIEDIARELHESLCCKTFDLRACPGFTSGRFHRAAAGVLTYLSRQAVPEQAHAAQHAEPSRELIAS